MTTNEMIIRVAKAKHEALYKAPWGKRKCNFELSEKCLGTAKEISKGKLQWKGRMCCHCVAADQRKRYVVRQTARGHLGRKVGRPIGMMKKSLKKSVGVKGTL